MNGDAIIIVSEIGVPIGLTGGTDFLNIISHYIIQRKINIVTMLSVKDYNFIVIVLTSLNVTTGDKINTHHKKLPPGC
ncbi:hypothetical protein [Edwardsiella hoshinae]|uniref:hypothetical protein n=1 Tax=Edwardsiella hoshinae TaxID=93378 RepID=UPI000AF6795F|nr:hypothetical protein [Edwardsiella hoshinae]